MLISICQTLGSDCSLTLMLQALNTQFYTNRRSKRGQPCYKWIYAEDQNNYAFHEICKNYIYINIYIYIYIYIYIWTPHDTYNVNIDGTIIKVHLHIFKYTSGITKYKEFSWLTKKTKRKNEIKKTTNNNSFLVFFFLILTGVICVGVKPQRHD